MATYYWSLILLSLMTFGTSSCSQDNHRTWRIDIQPRYTLPLPKESKPNSYCQKYYLTTDGREYLYYLNWPANTITVYDLRQEEIAYTIRLAKEGPHATGPVTGFTILADNEILLSSGGLPYNYIVDSQGKIVKKVVYDLPRQLPEYTSLSSRYFVDAFQRGDWLYLPQDIPFRNGIRPASVDHHPVVKYDLKSGTSQTLPFQFPQPYYTQNYPLSMTFTHDGENVYFSNVANHYIYRIDPLTEKTTAVKVKSSYVSEELNNLNQVGSITDYQLYDAANPLYTALLYDEFRKVFYRIVSLPPEPQVYHEKYVQLSRFPDRFAIMLLDDNLAIMDEFIVPERRYFPGGAFVGKAGLCIPKTHPEFMPFEDSLQIDVFRFEVAKN